MNTEARREIGMKQIQLGGTGTLGKPIVKMSTAIAIGVAQAVPGGMRIARIGGLGMKLRHGIVRGTNDDRWD